MEKPDLDLCNDFKKIGVFIEDKRAEIPSDANYLSLHVEIALPVDADVDSPNFDVRVQNQRGIDTLFFNFRVSDREGQKLFMFEACQKAPDNVPLHGNFLDTFYTSYLDICWKLGNNKIDDSVVPSVLTEPKKGAKHIDLGWVLPSRYVDSITNALGVLNNTILSNTMIDALVYGPYYTLKETK